MDNMDNIIKELLDVIEKPDSLMEDRELQKYLFNEMSRLSRIVDDQIPPRSMSAKIAALVRKAKQAVTAEDEMTRLTQLLNWFYQDMRFSCHYAEYFNTENLLLHKVMESKRGMPISLAALFLYLSASLALPIYPVNFPTQLMLRAEIQTETGRRETHFINPWNGDFLTLAQLEKWLVGEAGMGAEVTPDLIRRAESMELLERVETLFKMSLTKEKKYEEALRMIEFRLIFSPEDPYEIRDRGMILASMDCYQAAYEDLSYFIDQCPDDPSAVMLKVEMQGLEQKSKEMRVH